MSAIEIVVAAAIIISITAAAASAWSFYIRTSGDNGDRIQAMLLTEEASEALRILRDTSWNGTIASLSLETPYDIVWNGSLYSTTDILPVIQDRYRRSIIMSEVKRDPETDDVSETGTADPDTRKVTVIISTTAETPETLMQSEMLLHNTYGN